MNCQLVTELINFTCVLVNFLKTQQNSEIHSKIFFCESLNPLYSDKSHSKPQRSSEQRHVRNTNATPAWSTMSLENHFSIKYWVILILLYTLLHLSIGIILWACGWNGSLECSAVLKQASSLIVHLLRCSVLPSVSTLGLNLQFCFGNESHTTELHLQPFLWV